MKSFTVSFVTALLLLTISCKNTTDSNINEKTERVSISNTGVFEYRTGISGDEEGASIIRQAEHHQISEIVRDSTTEWEAVYRYKPKEGFKGKDKVEIILETGSDGASSNLNTEFIKIEITVH